MDEMQEEYESAVSNRRWDKKRQCYYNREGEPVVPKKDIIFDDFLLVVPLRAEYYRSVMKDDTYVKQYEKDIRYAMLSCLRKRDEEKMKKNVEEMVDNLKKVAEKVVEAEVVKEVVSIEQQIEEEVREEENKDVKSEAGDVGERVNVEEKQDDADQKQKEATEDTEVPITEVNSDSENLKLIVQCKKCMEPCRTCTEKDEQFRIRDLEFTKIENIFKEKCKEMLEKEKVFKENDEKLSERCNKLEKENEVLKENVLKITNECEQKEIACQEMKKEYD
ncbi:hypothetical protein Hanom_Chr10g00910221 [Helianthus anomalus]